MSEQLDALYVFGPWILSRQSTYDGIPLKVRVGAWSYVEINPDDVEIIKMSLIDAVSNSVEVSLSSVAETASNAFGKLGDMLSVCAVVTAAESQKAVVSVYGHSISTARFLMFVETMRILERR